MPIYGWQLQCGVSDRRICAKSACRRCRLFQTVDGFCGGTHINRPRQEKTHKQNDCVLLRFVKPFNLFFKYCVRHFSTSLSFKGIAPQKKTLCILPNPLPNYKRSDCGDGPRETIVKRAFPPNPPQLFQPTATCAPTSSPFSGKVTAHLPRNHMVMIGLWLCSGFVGGWGMVCWWLGNGC